MRLPPLNALRAFEAAARHESFARAASELCVTEGAVSRHVRLLEGELGVPLFRRLTRKVELTPHGQQFLPTVSEAFASIASGAARLAAAKCDFRITCSQTLALRCSSSSLKKRPRPGWKLRTNGYSEVTPQTVVLVL